MKSARTIVESLGGVSTRAQLLSRGLSGTDLTTAVRTGALVRVRRGYYAVPGLEQNRRTAVRIGGRLSCTSAAESFGLWGGVDERIHLMVPENASRLRTNYAPSIVRGQASDLSADTNAHPVALHWGDRSGSADCWRLDLPGTLRSAVACSDPETARAVLDTALNRRLVTLDEIARIFAHEQASSRELAASARHGCDSGVESITAGRFDALGLEFRQQVKFAGVGFVDFLVEGRIVVEIDGYGFHSSRRAFEHDRDRDAVLVKYGLIVQHYSALQVLNRWQMVADGVLAAVAEHC